MNTPQSSAELIEHYRNVSARLHPRGPEPAPKPRRFVFLPKPAPNAATSNLPVAVTRSLPKRVLRLSPVAPWQIIAQEVADKHGLTFDDIVGAGRTRKVSSARHEAMWRMSQELGLSLPDIGRRLGKRDHTTILHGVESHAIKVAVGKCGSRDIMVIASSDSPQITETVIAHVCQKYSLTKYQVLGRQQSNAISAARQEAYYILSTQSRMSTVAIGEAIGGRDHSTVRIGIKRHMERLAQK